jgi:GAF domain-containing protein
MADHAALFQAMAQYARTLMHNYRIGDVLYQTTDHVTAVLGASGAGVSLVTREGRLMFVTASDEQVARVEQGQMNSAEGPCHDAYHSGEPVLVPDLRRATYWPNFAPTALEAGCQAAAALPMRIGDRCIGALSIYDDRPREWAGDDVEAAQLLADMATGYILSARQLQKTRQLAEQLQHALDSRVVIEQAKGILAERLGIDPEAAFDILRGYARSHNRRLHDVAAQVIDRTLLL